MPFPESVGGRYSLWSSIGFPVAMAIGMEEFREFLGGAQAIDTHFREADGRDNTPLLAAFADQYYARVRGCQTRAVFAYDERLALFPDYLQQLELVSNGKSVTSDGEPVTAPTAAMAATMARLSAMATLSGSPARYTSTGTVKMEPPEPSRPRTRPMATAPRRA